MPSPFPGMNPYLEQEETWHDFHERYIPLLAELLSAQVDPHYIVKIDEHVYIHELPAEGRRFLGAGDVTVAGRAEAERGALRASSLESPVQVLLPSVDIERHAFVEIRDRRQRQLITVVEVLSPANKRRGPDREQFLGKRGKLLASPVHYVEIDLLRGGLRMPLEEMPSCDYYVMVSRADDRPHANGWPIDLKQPLPQVPVPLRPPDADAQLDLQEALHRVYDAARYATYIYDAPPAAPLTADETAWAGQIVSRHR